MHIHRPIDLRAPGAIDALLAFHRANFGSCVMQEGGEGGTPPSSGEAPKPTAPPAVGDDDGKGGKAAILADLATERDKRQALEQQVAQIQSANQERMEALARAFGLKQDEVSDADALAGKVTGLSEQLEKLTRANLVLSVVNDHPGLSEEDRKVVESIPDEATMRTVAARLAAASKPTGKPKADPPSGTPRKERDAVKPGMDRLRFAYDTVGDDN